MIVEDVTSVIDQLHGYRAVVTRATPSATKALPPSPTLHSVKDTDHLQDGCLATIDPRSGTIRTVYRPGSSHNTLFTTDRCNSNCLMCSQPPKDVDDSYRVALLLEQIDLMSEAHLPPDYLTITGGEPSLLGNDLLHVVGRLRDRLPTTEVQMLSNGRRFAIADYARALGAIRHPMFTAAVPLYADSAQDHDFIVQSRGAFDQTIVGLYQLARHEVRVEIRVVLHALSVPRLTELARYIYRTLPFAAHVALMGLEITGYTRANLPQLWIDPQEYRAQLHEAVEFLDVRGMHVSIYNHQLCLLDRELWPFAHKTISDWKNVYFDECDTCIVRDRCGGAFESSWRRRSNFIKPITATAAGTLT